MQYYLDTCRADDIPKIKSGLENSRKIRFRKEPNPTPDLEKYIACHGMRDGTYLEIEFYHRTITINSNQSHERLSPLVRKIHETVGGYLHSRHN